MKITHIVEASATGTLSMLALLANACAEQKILSKLFIRSGLKRQKILRLFLIRNHTYQYSNVQRQRKSL